MRHTLAAALLATLVATTAGAQMATRPALCTYDSCSLRQELFEIKRGAGNERIGRFGMFGRTAMTPVVLQTSDSALAYARVFDREYNRGVKMIWTGIVITAPAMTALLARTEKGHELDGVNIALGTVVLGGTVIEGIGGFKMRSAQKALSRAIWWHNRDLPR